jgi:hypothetical protein
MAFDPKEFIKSYKQKSSGGFDPDEFINKYKQQSGNFAVQQLGKTDTGSSSGLYNLAVKSGYQKEADRILSQKGEDSKKIFGGGFISDVFDVLNTLDYGVVGMLKGKSFSEGVKNRESFTKQDSLGKYGLAGTIGGTILDIAVDPLTYVSPLTIAKKIPALNKGITAVSKAAESSKVGKFLGEKFTFLFGAPEYKDMYNKWVRNSVVGDMNIGKLLQGIIDLPAEKTAKLLTKDATGRMIRKPLEELSKELTEDELFKVAKSYSILDDLGKQAVDLGLLEKGTWEKNVGEYIKSAYEKYEKKEGTGLFGTIANKIKGIKSRKDLTPEQMAELGQIKNPAYLLFKSMIDLNHDVETAKLFKATAETFGSDIAKEGFEKMPSTLTRGALAGKYVPKPIWNYLNDIQVAKTDSEKLLSKVVGEFKFNKVILNPATHARNMISNMILNWWKLGVNPITNADDYAEAAAEIARNSGKWLDEARTVGYGLDSFAANELRDSLLNGDVNGLGKMVKDVRTKLGDFYQGEENFAKLAAFINQRKKGLNIEDAWKAAESATFNYAQVTPFVRKLRQSIWGFPFITFTVKATPVVAETMLKNPARVSAIGKIKNSIENLADIKETEKERANEPAWIRNGFYIKLPMKDEKGRSAYFDLTYIIPFGDLISGQFLEGQIDRNTGIEEGFGKNLLNKNPTINFISEIARNQDFYGDKIWQDSDSMEKQMGDLFRHLTKTYTPPVVADQLPGGWVQQGDAKGTRRQKGFSEVLTPEQEATQKRTLMEEMLKQVGMKIQPINTDIQETYMEWEKKKALSTLLKEKGILDEFNKTYIPKD